VASRFDAWARGYDEGALQPLLYHAIHRAVLRRLGAVTVRPTRILDVGCGTGQLLRAAADRFPQTALVGADPSAAMLAVAATVAPARFVLAEAEHLPFADAAFDAVTATFTYRHWGDQTAGLAEIGRILASGGTFGLAALLPFGARQWPVRKSGPARLPETLVTGLADARLRLLDAAAVAGYGPIVEVTLILAGRERRPGAARSGLHRRPRRR
jgi:ubiquinone/menaquinone biosynthesis C-methylase UbiE